MKKKVLAIFIIVLAMVLTLTILPSGVFADGEEGNGEGGGEMLVFPGPAGGVTTISLHAWNATGTPILLLVFKFDGTWEELLQIGDENEGRDVSQYLVYGTLPEDDWNPLDENSEGFFLIDSDEWTRDIGLILGAGHYFAVVVPLVQEDEGDNNSGNLLVREFNVYQSAVNTHAVNTQWIRGNLQMSCLKVWINEKGNFEMLFWWPYANNNWVKIYDMKGNLVYSQDMSYDSPHIEVPLPDGMYIVRTYHDQKEPLQEFIIGK